MKKLILSIVICTFAAISSCYACYCSSTLIVDYQTANFVAAVRIIKNYKNSPDTNDYYKADIEIIDLYKGKSIKSIYILGSNGNNTYNSCGTFIKEGEVRLIFGNFNKENNMSTYLCTSYYRPLEAPYKRDQISQKLSLLKKYAEDYTIKIYNADLISTYDFKTTYDPTKENYFSLLKIKIDKNGLVKAIDYLTKDSDELKAAYDNYFRTKFNWSRIQSIRKENIDDITLFFEVKPYTSLKPKS